MPLGGRGSIFNSAASDRSVALQLSGDRRRRTTEPTRDLSHPTTTGEQDRDLLSLGEGQITPGHRRESERRHPATLAKPPDTNARQHTRLDRSLLARCTSSDRLPEPDPMLPSPRRRMSTPTRSGCSGTIHARFLLGMATPQRQALRQPVESTPSSTGHTPPAHARQPDTPHRTPPDPSARPPRSPTTPDDPPPANPSRRRQQERLITTTIDEVLSHPGIPSTTPDGNPLCDILRG